MCARDTSAKDECASRESTEWLDSLPEKHCSQESPQQNEKGADNAKGRRVAAIAQVNEAALKFVNVALLVQGDVDLEGIKIRVQGDVDLEGIKISSRGRRS